MIASVCPATNRLGLQTLRTNSVKPARPGRVQQVLVCLTVFLMFLMATGSALALGVGQRVQANGTVNVRNAPAGAILGTQSTGRQGTIIGGPQTVSLSGTSYTWWSINWDSSVDGWVASGGLTGLAPAAPTLNAPGDSSGPGSTTASLTPVLSWNAVNGATNYGVYVWDMTSGGLVYNRDYVGNVTSTTLPAA